MRAAASARNQDRVVAQLRAVRLAAVEDALRVAKSRKVVVTDERMCGVCLKRFGGSAIRVGPDGKVVHYGCVERGKGWGRREESGWA